MMWGCLVTVLLARDLATFHRTGTTVDSHGWNVGGHTDLGEWTVNIQESVSPVDRSNTDSGGSGPFAPATQRTGTVYAPLTLIVHPGDTMKARGVSWVIGAITRVMDPTSVGIDLQTLEVVSQ